MTQLSSQFVYKRVNLEAKWYFGLFIVNPLRFKQTGNPRDVISVWKGNPFAVILCGFSKAVLETHGQQVWKGITGPEQSPNFSDYWLWVEPVSGAQLQEGLRYDFQIAQCAQFTCSGGNFSYGVNITVVVYQPA